MDRVSVFLQTHDQGAQGMKIYIASHCKDLANQTRDVLELKGHEIVSRWIDWEFKKTEDYSVPERFDISEKDFADIDDCDCLVLLSGPEKYSGGKFVEAGYAIAKDKAVWVVGRRENMMLWNRNIFQIDDIREFPNA
jgi:nucleoside 2-deoxyribosyltransferase